MNLTQTTFWRSDQFKEWNISSTKVPAVGSNPKKAIAETLSEAAAAIAENKGLKRDGKDTRKTIRLVD
jgi:hypothetical protein